MMDVVDHRGFYYRLCQDGQLRWLGRLVLQVCQETSCATGQDLVYAIILAHMHTFSSTAPATLAR